MARYVVRTNPAEPTPRRRRRRPAGPATDVQVRERFDRCVLGVAGRGEVRDPFAVCARAFRKAYGAQFQRIAAEGRSAAAARRHARGEVLARKTGKPERRPASRLRPTAVERRGRLAEIERASVEAWRRATGSPVVSADVSAARRRAVARAQAAARPARRRAVANPVAAVLQTHVVGPGHATVEWVDVARGRWVDGRALGRLGRRPPRPPVPHLVAPGAQLLVARGPKGAAMSFARALFVRHHHRWTYLAPAGEPVALRAHAPDRVTSDVRLPARDARVLEGLLRHVAERSKARRSGRG